MITDIATLCAQAEVGTIPYESAVRAISKEINAAIMHMYGDMYDDMHGDIACPFCGETGFSKHGLKHHLSVLPCDDYLLP